MPLPSYSVSIVFIEIVQNFNSKYIVLVQRKLLGIRPYVSVNLSKDASDFVQQYYNDVSFLLVTFGNFIHYTTGLILGLRPANERRRYKVTASLIGWAQT